MSLVHVSTLRLMVVNFDTKAGGHEEEEQPAQAELWYRRASAIRWALGYVGRHVNLETGELTIPLDEPEEAA
ncbi:hypothetical protein LCGC14_0961990 [marine sediment metagenome]|uniref:Uncharacterized protein n=1 Tax=marine sediment metagenome TaxID=412755 RepID=A0A0F9P0F3_9ZZZZ